MITWIPYTGYGTVEQREKPPRNESFTHSDLNLNKEILKKKIEKLKSDISIFAAESSGYGGAAANCVWSG